MRLIPEAYRKNGWSYRLICRQGHWAIYEQLGEKRSWFELVRIRFAAARTIADRQIEEGEYLPSDNDWGRHGFTFQTETEARVRLVEFSLKTDTAHTIPSTQEAKP